MQDACSRALAFRQVVGIHGLAGQVALSSGAHEEIAPAGKCLVEARKGMVCHVLGKLLPAFEPWCCFWAELGFDKVKNFADPSIGHGSNGRARQGLSDLGAQWEAPLFVGVDNFGNGGRESPLGCRQPDGLQVAANQIFVGKIQRRRTYFAMHHRRRIGEKELIVWALGGAVGQD